MIYLCNMKIQDNFDIIKNITFRQQTYIRNKRDNYWVLSATQIKRRVIFLPFCKQDIGRNAIKRHREYKYIYSRRISTRIQK